MLAPLSTWPRRGKFRRGSPCGRYCVEMALMQGADVFYAMPVPRGPKIAGPFSSADEAWQACADDSAGGKAA